MVQVVGEIIAEGKTKRIIRPFGRDDRVLVRSKDDITAGDGARRDVIDGKATLATTTNHHVMTLLNRAGIQTHYQGREDETGFWALPLTMIPMECVARNVAYGSYLKRNPDVQKCTTFSEPVVEFFFKDDERHDPMMIWKDGYWQLYDARYTKSDESYLGDLTADSGTNVPFDEILINHMRETTAAVMRVLSAAWAIQNVTLVDLKIEFGWTADGRIVVGDVVDNDSWRIWPGGDESGMLDKQVYRVNEPTPEMLATVKGNYARVAEMVAKFDDITLAAV